MWGNASAGTLASRFARIVEQLGGEVGAARARGQQRALIAAVGAMEPATLNQVAAEVKRGAPAVSRAIDTLVREGLVQREADPGNRRRLALKLSAAGEREMQQPPATSSGLTQRIERLAHSELRAVERAVEILERNS